ncbi:MAG TPA: DUF3300 domain-containing protein [Syntrophales bacterium]|nr:DUF3300 domain-containing protein [Syntrophales bacterium]
MFTATALRRGVIWLTVLAIALPAAAGAQNEPAAADKFSQAELDQMLAPVALYPDELLAQVLMAATYPLEVVMADRWVRENKDFQGDALNDALDKMPWDPSVKALAPFPDVLSMMSQNLEWTQRVGDAFLSQQADVMGSVQRLRDKAAAQGNLQSTAEQKVSRSDDVIVIEPTDTQVIYVPAYDPLWVYGPWWWPAYPPFILYPYPGFVVAPGFIWFGIGFHVGVHWCTAWGHWDWHHRAVFVNANRSININRAGISGSGFRTQTWTHSPFHRRGVIYRDQVTRERFGRPNQQTIENRRPFRGFPETARPGVAAPRQGEPVLPPGMAVPHAAAPQAPSRPSEGVRQPGMTAPRPEIQRAPERPATAPSQGQGHIFEGMHEGGAEVQHQSNWGRESLSPHGAGQGGGGFHGGHR